MTEPSSLSELLQRRWSPRAYLPDGVVEPALIDKIFSAARWAQSSYNEQPWRFLIAERPSTGRSALEDCLDPGNVFAKEAWLLGIVFARPTLAKNGRPNPHAAFDAGAASQLLSLQAFDLGLHMRFMAGFNREKAALLAPEGNEPLAMFVIGRATPEALEAKPDRIRKPLEEILLRDVWPRSK